MTTRTAIVAGTPWQLMGALALACAGTCGDARDVDLFLRPGFAQAQEITGRLRAEQLFGDVLTVNLSGTEVLDARGGATVTASDVRQAAASLDAQLDHPAANRRYDLVLCTYPYDTVAHLLACSPSARFWMYDDGLGSYAGDILEANGGGAFPRPDRLYLCAPQLAQTALCTDIRQLPLDMRDATFCALVTRVFDIDERALDCYLGKRIVLLTQPADMRGESYQAVTKHVYDVLSQHASEVIVRRHPRDAMRVPEAFDLDSTGIPWEMSCALGAIREEMVLIAECSTAQLTPKVFGGVEPRIVFLSELYDREAPHTITPLSDALRAMITSAYDDPTRVKTPTTWEELSRILI